MIKKVLSVAVAGALMLSLTGGAVASPMDWFKDKPEKHEAEDKRDAELMTSAKVSLVQAIGVAEQQTAEKAVGADLEKDCKSGAVYYQIETTGAQGGHTVNVDAVSGKIVKVQDGNGSHDEHDGEEEDREEKD